MSAYIVDRNHILYLVQAALSRRLSRHGGSAFRWFCGENKSGELLAGDYDRAADVANLLWRENIASVSGRYPNESSATLPGPINENFVIEPSDFARCVEIDPIQVLKSCDCFEYQSCEHDGWRDSEAKAFIDSLRNHAWHALPGYENAAWGAPERPTVGRKVGAR
jgi:hypothetical protein